MTRPLLGAIADDFTGATDLCNTLVRTGLRTVQLIDLPQADFPVPEADALVVALKSRSIEPGEAVRLSLAALRYLQAAGARQILFKYCSTFDSTERGNIGPVADALLDALGADFTIACPAFPETKRTIYLGHLFVGEQLLSDSPMKDHPLTPMRDANLVRVLAQQTRRRVGLVPLGQVAKGEVAIRAEFERLAAAGVSYAVVDAVEDRHLLEIGAALARAPLITGGSGIALGLADNFRRTGVLPARHDPAQLANVTGPAVVLAGSCSAATNRQVAHFQATRAPARALDPRQLTDPTSVAQTLAWCEEQVHAGRPCLVYSTANPEQLAAVQAELGAEPAARAIEQAFAAIAAALFQRGVRRWVVAGGETAGAVVQALGVRALAIGEQIDPGVPSTVTVGGERMALALKSGNFGADDFFVKALARL